jgi:hypothetical protein
MHIHEFLKGYRSSFQNVVIEKLMGSDLLKDCVLKYLHDLRKIKQNQVIVDNFKSSLSNHLSGQKPHPLSWPRILFVP